jgi:hypothetical protein
MNSYRVPYRMGFRYLLLGLFGVFLVFSLAGMATANKRGLIINNGIYLSPQAATHLYWIGAAFFTLGTVYISLGLIRSLLLPGHLELSDTQVAIPRMIFFGSKKVPYTSIKNIQEWSRRGRPHRMILTTSSGRLSIVPAMLPDLATYETVKRSIAARIGSRTNLPPWKQGGGMRPIPAPPRRSSSLGLAFGLTSIALGGYSFFISHQSEATPTIVPIGQFENNPPPNRNVIITGGYFDIAHAVKFEEFAAVNDIHPTITYFVPLTDEAPGLLSSAPPRVIVEISEFLLEKEKHTLTQGRIAGLRVTHWELNRAVQAKLRESFGPAVDDMIVVDYGRHPNIYFGLIMMAIGVLFLLAKTRARR